jgi:hypothetical protein
MPFKLFTTPQTDPGLPPSGGVQAYLQILAGHLINALTWGYSASFGIYQAHYTSTLHLPASQIAWIGSIQVFFTFMLSTFSGRAADAGYASHAVLLGTVLIVLGTFMTSLSTTYWQILLAQGVCGDWVVLEREARDGIWACGEREWDGEYSVSARCATPHPQDRICESGAGAGLHRLSIRHHH